MKINRNMSAVVANTHLLQSEDKLKISIERLSSGLKINNAVDNPAGMAISNKMKAQIDALNQAEMNSNDGVSVLQIADGALGEVESVLQRMRELAVQAATDSCTYSDRQNIQEEISQLKKEVDRISSDTEYNTKKLLDGSADTRVYADGLSRINISDGVPADYYKVRVDKNAKPGAGSFTIPDTFSSDGIVSVNGVQVNVYNGMSKSEFLYALDEACEQANATCETNGNLVSIASNNYGSNSQMEICHSVSLNGDISNLDATLETPDADMYISRAFGEDAELELIDGFTDNASKIIKGDRVYIRDADGFKMDFKIDDGIIEGSEIEIQVTDIGRMTIQSGSNQYHQMDIRIPEVSTESMYLDTVNLSVSSGASDAIETVDEAIAKLNETRSRIGAFQNRLEYEVTRLTETQENMTGAYSQILDTDMAEEMTEYANENIINQAAISVLSQANDIPKQILSLLS